jgi:hypothetical protein
MKIKLLCFLSVCFLSWCQLSNADAIYFNDFENTSNLLTEWSPKGSTPYGDPTEAAPGIAVTPGTLDHPTDRFFGQFTGDEFTTLTLNNLPAHTQLSISFDLYIIRTWDGIDPMGPDVWDLSIVGGQTLLHTTFNNFWTSQNLQSYPDAYTGGVNLHHVGAAEINTLGFRVTGYGDSIMDSIYRFPNEYHSFTFDHTASSIEIKFSGFALQSGSLGEQNVYDESWGLDNVVITPEPATFLLLGLGGLILRRRK